MLNTKQIMNDKKGSAEIFWIIIGLLLAVVVVILILMWFKGSGGKVFDTVDTQIGNLGDKDSDKVPDMLDKCPNTVANVSVNSDGCSSAQQALQAK